MRGGKNRVEKERKEWKGGRIRERCRESKRKNEKERRRHGASGGSVSQDL